MHQIDHLSTGSFGTITSSGATTYSISATGSYGGGGGTINTIGNTGNFGGVYTIGAVGATGSSTGLWNGINNTVYGSSPSVNIGITDTGQQDITLSRQGKPPMKIGHTIDMILDHLGIIIPDEKLMESNPSVKLAYEYYLEVYTKISITPELQTAIDNYRMVEKLVKEEPEED